MKRVLTGLLLAALAQLPFAASAETYPDKTVKLIVPWPAGGSADTIGRLVAAALGTELGTSIFVDNIAGASGTIGTQQAVHAQADGYTLLLATSSANASAPFLMKKVGFDPIKDFRPIGLVASAPSIMVVNVNSRFKSPKDVVEEAKKHPGRLSYGSGGNGNSGHLSGELFKSVAKISAVHIPYKGNTPAMVDLMGGQIDYMFDNGAIPMIKAGKVRALAVASDKRLQALPELPTFGELGLKGVVLDTWFGIAAPANTPAPVVAKISAALRAALAKPETAKRLMDMGAEVRSDTPEEFNAYWKKELTRYQALIKLSGATLE